MSGAEKNESGARVIAVAVAYVSGWLESGLATGAGDCVSVLAPDIALGMRTIPSDKRRK